MRDFLNKKIVLGICGGIAAYKSAYLVRELTALGAEVRVVMTESAQQFITPLTFQALTGHEVRTDLFDSEAERAMGHIELARWADYLLIAPATANCLAQLAHGLANDLLSTLYLVCQTPVIICPAMNQSMWTHPATVHNCAVLRDRGVFVFGPDEGIQACGEFGYGRMLEPAFIIEGLRLIGVHQLLAGKKVMVTAGPTIEPIDPVRFISNRSSGRMGYALAMAAQMAGAEVTLVTGPTALPCPPGVHFQSVQSASEMYDAVFAQLSSDMIFIGCAAVADYAVEHPVSHKIKKQANHKRTLDLVQNPDILMSVAESKQCAYVVGFAAETHEVREHARSKLQAKQLDMIVANQVSETLGFEQLDNEVILIRADDELSLPKMHKTRLAGEIIKAIAKNLGDDFNGLAPLLRRSKQAEESPQ